MFSMTPEGVVYVTLEGTWVGFSTLYVSCFLYKITTNIVFVKQPKKDFSLDFAQFKTSVFLAVVI